MTRFLLLTAAFIAFALVPVEAQAKRKPLCTNSYQEIKGKCEPGGNRNRNSAPIRSQEPRSPGSSGNTDSKET